jgi:ribokinase
MDTLGYTLDFCAKAQVPVMLDPAPAAALPDAAFAQVAWFTPNETEAAFYVGDEKSVDDTAQRLHAKGLRGVVLKRGAEGAFVSVAGERAEWVKPFKVDAIDTVGAGDCFNGAFAVALEEGKDPWAAARFANAASAISVTRKGAQASMPWRVEVDEFLGKHS